MIEAARVSVVIPVHNGATYLNPTLRSVLDQTMPAGEIIVVDDGSHDDSASIARSLGATVISQPKGGPAAARNTGTRAATGDYVAYLDADDLWTADKLAIQLAALAALPQPAFSFTDFRVFDERGVASGPSGLWAHPTFRQTVGKLGQRTAIVIAAGEQPVLRDNYILPSSLIARRSDILAIGGFDETIQIGLEDYELLLRLFARAAAVAVMQPLLMYRRHDKQLTSKTIAMKLGFFEVARRVAAAPDRYPAAEVRYFAGAAYRQYQRIGLEHARIGQFAEAEENFKRSLAAKRTIGAGLGVVASRLGRSGAGRALFGALRTTWKARPRRR